MKNLSPELKQSFDRVLAKYQPREYSHSGGLSELDVVKAYYILSDYFYKENEQIHFGIKSFDLLASSVARQEVEFDGHKKWTDEFDIMGTLVYGLVKNHAFEDGNKRTALLSLLLLLNRKKYKVTKPKTDLENLIVRIAANKLSEYGAYKFKENDDLEDDYKIKFISSRIKSCVKKKNHQIYELTFREFQNKLQQFNVLLDDPKKGYIKIYKMVETEEGKTMIKRLMSLGKDKQTNKKVHLGTIPFRGWTKNVGLGRIKEVLSKAGLTPENGIDSGVFFNNEEPEYELIKEYREPLIRLKDR